jgi:hypothetical protein
MMTLAACAKQSMTHEIGQAFHAMDGCLACALDRFSRQTRHQKWIVEQRRLVAVAMESVKPCERGSDADARLQQHSDMLRAGLRLIAHRVCQHACARLDG